MSLMADTRLSGDARTLGWLISVAGDDGFAYSDLEDLMPDLSRAKIRAAIQKLERCKWVERTVGGRDRPDRFAFIEYGISTTYETLRLANIDNLKDRLPKKHNLSGLSVRKTDNLKLPPPITTPPPPPPPDARVENAIRQEVLRGCRKALREYLNERVEPDKRHAYVQRIVTSLQGADEWMWKGKDGTTITEGRTGIIAGGLNELMSGDERGSYFTGPPGSYANLRGKVRYAVQTRVGLDGDIKKGVKNVENGASNRGNGRGDSTKARQSEGKYIIPSGQGAFKKYVDGDSDF